MLMRLNKNPKRTAELSKAIHHSESESEDILIKKNPQIRKVQEVRRGRSLTRTQTQQMAIKNVPKKIYSSVSESEDNIAFKANSFVAFIHNNDRDQVLALAKVLKDSLASESEISVKLYAQDKKNTTSFALVEGSLMIHDWSVIFSVDLAKGTSLNKTVMISKKTLTQVVKLMDNMIDTVKAKYEKLDSSHKGTDSDEEDSEEESEPEYVKRKIVRARRTFPKTQIIQSVKQKPPVPKSIDENDSSDEGFMSISPKKSATAKLKDIKIGVKRKQSAEEISMTQPAGKKVKKLEGGPEELVPDIKKAAKLPVIFKKGKWNPDTEVLQKKHEIERCGPSNYPVYNCCVRCNMRNLIRAVETKNYGLFKSLVYDLKNIPSLCQPWSESSDVRPFNLIMEMGDTKMMEILVDIKGFKKSKLHSKEDQIREFYLSNRVQAKKFLLNTINTGSVNYKAYGARVRSVAMTRGNRQGNQAFLPRKDLNETPSDYFTSHLDEFSTASIQMLKACLLLFGLSMDELAQQAWDVALSGNKDFLTWIVEFCLKSENFGFNKLHLDVLKLGSLKEKYHTASITKKAGQCAGCTPLHFAALNPNKNVLKQLLEQNNDFNVVTSKGNFKPIHFAAKCESSGPLELLIERGASIYDVTTEKKNVLHFAAMAGRAENIKVLLAAGGPMLLKVRDKTNMSPMAYACRLGEIQSIKAFLEHSNGQVKVNQGQGPERLTPLHWAAQAGKYELAEWLINNKARVLSKDKFKRTPLILAVKNGHTKLASLLLRYGSEWNHQDSSNNTPLHYAAGSGFIECIDLLILHGADVNASNNWKTTPIMIAMLLNHQGTVKRLLDEGSVDVNGKDENGNTLLSMLMTDLTDASCVNFAKFLLEKGANPNINDLDGNNVLHLLASYDSKIEDQVERYNSKEVNDSIRKNQQEELDTLEKMIELMILRGSNLQAINEEKKTPFDLALDSENVQCLKQLSAHVKLSESPELLHKFKSKIFDDRYKSILIDLIKKGGFNKEQVNCFDKNGYTPFLAYIEEYSSGIKSGRFTELINDAVKRQFAKQKDKSKITIQNEDLYVFIEKEENESQEEENDSQEEENESQEEENDSQEEENDSQEEENDSQEEENDSQEEENGSQEEENDSREEETQEMPEEDFKPLVNQILENLITKPLIELLKLLVNWGAEPHAKVAKTEFYRELDEQKRRLAMVDETREDFALINTKTQTVKTRKEVLAQQQVKKQGKNQNEKGHIKIDKKLKKFYASKGYHAIFEKINGKLVEIEYKKEVGMQNAVHMCMKTNAQQLFKYLVDELKVPADEIDYQGRNPFMIFAQAHPTMTEITVPQQKLLSMKVKFDLADQNGITPFLTYYEHQNYEMGYKLLQQGVNIMQMDNSGHFALKYALIRRENTEIKKLVSLGADINQIDTKGRNLLHHAVNMSTATADATFETEKLLIDFGININQLDLRGRVPLHYAFVKQKGWKNSKFIDPIVTVSSLCNQKGLAIEVADQWLKTPLHYAAQRGAAICSLYILQRGSNIEAKDIYGNTALGICLKKKHFNYGIILIQKNADVTAKVYDEYPKRLAKKWKDEQEADQKDNVSDVDMEQESEEEVVETGRDLFKQKIYRRNQMINSPQGSECDSQQQEESDENHGSEGDSQSQEESNQNHGSEGDSQSQEESDQNHDQNNSQNKESKIEKETEPKSMFRVAIKNQQQGIAFLILDNGFDYMLAMQDALDEKQFQLMLNLLSKTSDDEVVKQKNAKNQNLIHILAQNSKGEQNTHLKYIYETLKSRGVKCLELDSLRSNALHYAVSSKCFELCEILIKEGINVNQLNNLGHSPLSLLLQGATAKVNSLVPKPESNILVKKNLFTLLAQNSADMNVCYPETAFGESYNCSILINFIRQAGSKTDLKLLMSNLKCLIDLGARLDVIDSSGRDAMMYAVMQNQSPLVSFLITNKKKGLLINHQDSDGKTAPHFVVSPVGYGSYENTNILALLHSSAYKLDINDSSGQEPLDYALKQQSGKLGLELQSWLKRNNSKRKNTHPIQSYVPLAQWPELQFSFAEDSQQFLEEAESKRAQQIDGDKSYVPIDESVSGEKQYKVYFDKEGKPWDTYLVKVDLQNGVYGDYVFYKIQLLHDTNRDLYIVLTRYGRIGESGINQRSPFPEVEDAKKDFASIFKQKSANEWDTALTSFVKQPKKYNLVKVHYSNIKHQDYLAPFDFDNCCKHTYLDQHVKQMVEEISNVTMYQRAIQKVGIDKDLLPISALRKETLQSAKEKLGEIKVLLDKWIEMKELGMKADFDEAQRNQDQLFDLSSQYFELIPMSENKDSITRPIKSIDELQNQFQKLDTLLEIEFSSRILIGALFRQIQVNPIEYVYESLNTHINQLQPGDGEHDLIHKYIMNSYDQKTKFKQLCIFKLQRKGEGERFEKFKHLENRRMLFHGSAMTNMLGILAQGLRIAPPEAPSAGQIFGKGIYFADTFKKSSSYTQGHGTRLMLVCEVALGNLLKLYKPHFVENLPKKYHSVMGCGAKGPQYEIQTLLTPEGVQIPIGANITYEQPSKSEISKSLAILGVDKNNTGIRRNERIEQNEFIVYNLDQVRIRYLIQFQM